LCLSFRIFTFVLPSLDLCLLSLSFILFHIPLLSIHCHSVAPLTSFITIQSHCLQTSDCLRHYVALRLHVILNIFQILRGGWWWGTWKWLLHFESRLFFKE
jgi:hypothetical protein